MQALKLHATPILPTTCSLTGRVQHHATHHGVVIDKDFAHANVKVNSHESKIGRGIMPRKWFSMLGGGSVHMVHGEGHP